MEKLNTKPEEFARLKKDIHLHLTRITRLQELLRQEEEKLYSCLRKEKFFKETNSST
jgi:hypothetical protein